jgi:hypothetical protein
MKANKSILDLGDAIHNAMTRKKSTIEGLLGGALIFDRSCLSRDAMAYAQGAVSVDPKHMSNRGNNFTLVLGPSGSGKTFFALYCLPQLVFASTFQTLIVHFKARTVRHLMTREKITSFPKAVALLVDKQIKYKLSREKCHPISSTAI